MTIISKIHRLNTSFKFKKKFCLTILKMQKTKQKKMYRYIFKIEVSNSVDE